MCLFSVKAFLILAIIMAKIIYLGFLASCASRVALIIQISSVLSLFRSSIVSYIISYLGLGLVLGTELVLDLGLGSLSILFIIGYQSFQYFQVLSLNFCLVQGDIVVRVSLQGLVEIPDPQQILVEFLYQQNLVEFLGQQNLTDSLSIGWILVEILDQQILVDFLDFSLGLGWYIIRHFCL